MNKLNTINNKLDAINIIKQNDWYNSWDSVSRLFSYIPPLNSRDEYSSIENERKSKINNRSSRYFY